MILITGANGQLGHDYIRIFKERGVEFIATDYKELDITNILAVREFLKGKGIKLIINCAAYNNVDKAESESELCYFLNAYSPRDLALVAKEIGAEYMTYSTDFVFDGKKGSPYTEEDEVSPLSVYSRAKALGEKLTLEAYDKSFVVRTSWVFGIANNNFNRQVINWSKGRDNLSIVDDQTSSPTYSYDLALYSLKLLATKRYGLYHLSNSGEASKYDQAEYLLDSIGWTGTLNRGRSADFKLPAKRAEYSKLDSSKLEAVIGEKLPTWQSGIDRFLDEMKMRGEL
ncbi:MAG: dTDP-4-dehydrorhamnose reductase [Fusobacteriaceae bacterium]